MKSLKKFYLVLLGAIILSPVFSFAQSNLLNQGNNANGLEGTIYNIQRFISGTLIPFIIGIAVLVFIFGLFEFVTAGGDEEKLKTARNTIIWGIVIIAVMISVWGLVGLVVNTFGLNKSADTVTLPNYIPQGNDSTN